ncbi:hypothetical protein ACJQWK_09706 [Exserohilum turcicum]
MVVVGPLKFDGVAIVNDRELVERSLDAVTCQFGVLRVCVPGVHAESGWAKSKLHADKLRTEFSAGCDSSSRSAGSKGEESGGELHLDSDDGVWVFDVWRVDSGG